MEIASQTQDLGSGRGPHLANQVDEVLSRQLAALSRLLQRIVHHRRHVVDQDVLGGEKPQL